jgi:hypothetical protein
MGTAALIALIATLAGGAAAGAGAAAGGASFLGGNQNVNTEYANNPIYQQMFGSGGGYANAQGQMSSLLNQAITTGQNYDPNAFWKDFMGAQPELQNLISGPTSSIKAAQEANLADFSKTAVANTAQEMSGMGSLYSGAFGDIVGQTVGKEASKAGVDLASLQANMYNSMWGNMIPQFSQNRQFQTSNVMNAMLQGSQNYGNMAQTMLGLGADMSTPMYEYQPGVMDYIMKGMGLGGSIGGGLGSLFGGGK